MPRISVIVPVYNAEAFLTQSIESILVQSFNDFELILVDDGSMDGSGDICDAYSKQDHRVRVIHQANAGVSAARNAGLHAARGEWVTFVDSDDIVLDCFLSSLLSVASMDKQIDLAYCGYAIADNSMSIKTYRTHYYVGVESIRQILSSTKFLFRCSPWAKLFRSSIIKENGLEFDANLQISEDRLFVYNYLLYVRGIAATSTIGYLYGSFSSTSLKHKRVSTDMLIYRQRTITTAAHNVIEHFGMGGGEAFLVSRHLVLILFELIRNVYYDSGTSSVTVIRQKELFDELFDVQLYKQNLEGDRRWQNQLSGNVLLKYLVEKRFSKLNKKLFYDELNLKFRQKAQSILRRDKGSMKSFGDHLSIINS